MDLQTLYHQIFQRTCCFTFQDYMVALPSEIEQEKKWARSRPGVRKRHEENPELQRDNSAWACLTASEVERAQQARAHLTEDCAVDLGQNFEHRQLCTRRGKLHTLIKGGGVTWCFQRGMWMTASELWIAQGFPVSEAIVQATGVQCQFSSCRSQSAPAVRTRSSQISQIGNTMHVNVMGSLMMLILLRLPSLDANAMRAARGLQAG